MKADENKEKESTAGSWADSCLTTPGGRALLSEATTVVQNGEGFLSPHNSPATGEPFPNHM